MKNKILIFLELIYPIILYSIISVFSSTIIFIILAFLTNSNTNIQDTLLKLSQDENILMIIANISAFLTLIILIIINILRKDNILNIKNTIKKAYIDKKFIILLIIFCLLSTFLSNGIINLPFITNLVSMDTAFQETDQVLANNLNMLSNIFVIILAPIVEEYVFRRMLFAPLRKYVNFVKATLISALVFAIFHGNVVQGLYAFILGLILAYIYESSNNILICIIAHSLANFASKFISVENLFDLMNLSFESGMIIYTIVLLIIEILLFTYICKYRLKLIGGYKNEDS